MKQHARKLLTIIPLLPLLMGNSPAPQIRDEGYKDFEVSYLSVETYHGYNFYHFQLNNTGNGYIQYVYLTNEANAERVFYASLENSDISQPFNDGLIEPGYNKEIVVLTKDTIPESKKVKATAYAFSTIADEVTISGSKSITYIVEQSDKKNNVYYYQIDCSFSGMNDDYYYGAAIKLNYKGETYCIRNGFTSDMLFTTTEELDMSQLSVNEIVALKSEKTYIYMNDFDIGGALKAVLIFLLICGLLLSFGIFAAIFFPAMARRRRRKALLEQNNK